MQVWPKPAGQTVYSRGVSTPIGLVPVEAIDCHRIKIRSRVTASSATCRAAREFSRTTPPLRIEKSAGSKTPSRMPSPRGCPLESGMSAGIKVGFGRNPSLQVALVYARLPSHLRRSRSRSATAALRRLRSYVHQGPQRLLETATRGALALGRTYRSDIPVWTIWMLEAAEERAGDLHGRADGRW